MGDFFTKLIEQFKTIWGGLNRVQKVVVVSVIGLVFVSLVLIITFAGREEFVVLYSGISAEEAGAITSKLDEWRQEYKLDGTTIWVPIRDRDRLRLRIAAEELAPTGGIVGFDIFDRLKLTTTDYERRINYRRALEGELTRTIETIEGVEKARVHLVIPQKTLYIEDEIPTTASITLKLKPYAKLSEDQIRGIVLLTSAAVPGLAPQDVMIVDSAGNPLTDFLREDRDDFRVLASRQLEVQRAEEQKIERKIRQRLGRILGADRVEVLVRCEMNFDRLEERAESYSRPGFEQLKVSEELELEEFEGTGVKPGGPPGVEANVPGYKGMEEVTGPVKYTKDEKRINYLADKTEVLKIRSPYFSKISVSVMIDGTYERDEEGRIKRDEKGVPIYIPRTDEEMAKYEEVVWAAIGAEKGKQYEGREYVVTVKNVQFDRTREWEEEEAERRMAAQRRLMMYFGLAALAIVFVGVGFLRWAAWKRRLKEEELRRRREMEREAALRAAEEKRLELELAPEDRERIELEERATALAREQPDRVADLVRTWLAEEE